MEIFMFIIGTVLGSFYLVIGKRLPKGEDAFFSRSKCDNCNHTLLWYDLFPILSYVFLKGKCRYCHKKISIVNPIIEVSLGITFALIYHFFNGYMFYSLLVLASLMFMIFITDFYYYIILDSPLIISSILFFILKFIFLGYKEAILSLVSGLVLFLVMYLIKLIGDFAFKKESLGGGDIKLSFVIGYLLNIKLSLISLVLASFLALPYSVASLKLQKNNEVAFGPFLSSSLFIVFLFQDKFINLLNLL